MKKSPLIIIFLCAIAIFSLVLYWYFPQNNTITEKNGLTYYHEKEFGLTIVLSKTPIDFFIQNPASQSLSEVAQNQKYRVAVNGSYFTPDYEHAGLLYFNNREIVPIARRDQQLSTIVSLVSSTMHLSSATEFNTSTLASTTLAFQTGPQLIDKNQITVTAINNSLNGQGEYQRTLLGFTEAGHSFVAVITTRKNLNEIANKLLSLKLLANDTISVVNLDGGPSTALYTPEMPELNFRETKYLPIIIGIR